MPRGPEFQALFHWHVADLGMEHVYIKPRTLQLNGKVERSHRTDKEEFYQLPPIAMTSISRKSWLPGKASTITIDRTARTVKKRHMKFCGRSYASE